MGRKSLKLPKVEECDKQLSMLRFKTTTRGLLQVHHENERDRDDFPDAIRSVAQNIINSDEGKVVKRRALAILNTKLKEV